MDPDKKILVKDSSMPSDGLEWRRVFERILEFLTKLSIVIDVVLSIYSIYNLAVLQALASLLTLKVFFILCTFLIVVGILWAIKKKKIKEPLVIPFLFLAFVLAVIIVLVLVRPRRINAQTDLIASDANGNWYVAVRESNPRSAPEYWPKWLQHWDVTGGAKVMVGDVDGDHKPDIVAGNGDGTWTVALNSGSGFDRRRQWLRDFPPAGDGELKIYLADVDGDPDHMLDLVAKTAAGNWYVATSSGLQFQDRGSWMAPGVVLAVGALTPAYVADVNADNKADLVTRDGANRWWVALSNGSGFDFQPSESMNNNWPPGGGGYGTFVADVNGDHAADLIARNEEGDWYVAKNNGQGQFAVETNPWLVEWPGAGSSGFQVADVDGDGRADLVTNMDDGNWYVATSNGRNFVRSREPWLTNWTYDLFIAAAPPVQAVSAS